MAARKPTRILGVPVDVIDVAQAAEWIVARVETSPSKRRASPPGVVVTLNPEMVMLARRDPAFAAIVESAALRVPDGIGVVRALRRRGYPQAVRVGGVDLLEDYLPRAVRLGHRIALAGAGPRVAEEAARRLRERWPDLQVVAADGGDPDAALAERLRRASPDVVCAAFGQKRQEVFLQRHLRHIGAAVGIGVGGWLDYAAGGVRRAPRMVRGAGMEWAWRLVIQPRRLPRQMVLPLYWVRERREVVRLRGLERGS